MENNKPKKVVIGVIGHLPFDKIPIFKKYIEDFPEFRLIRFQESDNKLWIIDREGLH